MKPPMHVQLLSPDYARISDRLMRGIMAYSKGHGSWMFRALSIQTDLLATLKASRADAFLLFLNRPVDLSVLAEDGRPAVQLVAAEPHASTCAIHLDERKIGALGAVHLIERRFRTFGFYGIDTPWSREREVGFVQTLAAHGYRGRSLEEIRSGSRPSWTDAFDLTHAAEWLKRLELPAGVMACNDGLAIRLLEACDACHLSVPDDLALLGVDNDDVYCDFASVPISSVDPDLYKVGYESLAMLHRMLNDPERRDVPGSVIVPPLGVVVRRSTDVMSVDDPDVRAGLKFIRDKACEGIGIDDVGKHLALSRRTVEQRFRKVLDCSPGDEIRSVRLRRARELLVITDMKLVEITSCCGFRYLSYFSRAFKQAFGQTPRDYREQHRSR